MSPSKSVKELDDQIAALQKQRDETIAKARSDARAQIESILKEAETSLDEVFPELARRTGAKKSAARKPRQAGTPKYVIDGKEIDGRAARRHPGFEKVIKGGKIDDTKAAAGGLINPKWAAEQPERVLKAMKLEVPSRAKKRSSAAKKA